MSDSKAGGPAFPTLSNEYGCSTSTDGMSLLDYFAGKALQGFIVSPQYSESWLKQNAACTAYQLAALMIAERNKP